MEVEPTKIAVDIDSTLYDFETIAREAMLTLYQQTGEEEYKVGSYHPWTEWRSPADALGVDRWLRAIGLCHQPEIIRSRTPFEGAVETCNALSEQGHHLLFISNRNPDAANASAEWLESCGFLDYDNVEIRCMMDDKKPFLKDCQYLIDDRLKTAVEFVHDFGWQQRHGEMHDPDSKKRRAFVKAYAYNQAATDLQHLYLAPTWAGLNVYLVSKGVLPEYAYQALAVA